MHKLQRRQKLLQAIIQEYIKTARPMSSKVLVEEFGFDYSPATIRNDMAALEQAGLIAQPHTSAGRIPTEKGYQYYIQNFLHHTELSTAEKQTINELFAADVPHAPAYEQQRMRHIAKTIAELTDEAVVISVNRGETIYSTGISHIFRKPEFSEVQTMVSMSEALDRLDEIMMQLDQAMDVGTDDIQIFMGEDNPFSRNCSVMITEYEFSPEQPGMLAILGPMRMDYQTNIALLEYIESLMDQHHETRSE